MPNLSIVILNYNGLKETSACLSSLRSLSPKNFTYNIFVIDNNSKNNEAETIKKNFPEINIIHLTKNMGFTGGNNIGIKEGLKKNADYILLLNNDTVVKEDFLAKMLDVAQKDKRFGILGSKIYFAKGYEYHKNRYEEKDLGKVIWYAGGKIDWDNILFTHRGLDETDTGKYEEIYETEFVSGCCMLIRKEVIENIGLLDDKYFLYLEDVDFCLRAKKAGFVMIYVPKSIIWHKNASSTNKPGSKIHQYYQTRNRLYFGMKYGKTKTKIALFKEAFKMLMAEKQRRAIIDFLLGRMGRGLSYGLD